MKRLFMVALLCITTSAAWTQNNDQSLLKKLLGNEATNGTLQNILEDVVGGAVSELNLAIDGTWTYQEPQVQFKSDDLLSKAGGAASTAKIESVLDKLYGAIGMNNSLSYTFNSDSTFTQQIKIGSSVKTLGGTYSLDKGNKIITLKYSAFGKVTIGKINAIYANTGVSLTLLFDATELLDLSKKLLNAASSIAGKSSMAAITKVVDNYDGVLLGYKMQK